MPQRNLLILLVVIALSYACYIRGEQNPYARYASSGFEAIDQTALQRVPPSELFDGAMQGMVDVLRRHGDSHSQFLPQAKADPLRTDIRQQFGGIGVRIRLAGDPPRLLIAAMPDPGTPAAAANLLPGDQILAIDGLFTEEMSMSDVLLAMRGEPGTELELTVRHGPGGESITQKLTRGVINMESVLGDVHSQDGAWQFGLSIDPRIAHIRITSFGDRTAQELSTVLQKLTAGTVAAVALDLRDNPGGALEAAVAVCDLFLPEGKPVVETWGRDNVILHRYVTSADVEHFPDLSSEVHKLFQTLPVTVLVNQNTASAGEIVAACLQDHKRAIIVGERTYGKGTVQQLLPMESGGSLLKLTWAGFRRPGGANIHRRPNVPESAVWGVAPDAQHEVRLSPDEYAVYQRYRFERDLQGLDLGRPEDAPLGAEVPLVPADFVDAPLAKAVEYLRGELAIGDH